MCCWTRCLHHSSSASARMPSNRPRLTAKSASTRRLGPNSMLSPSSSSESVLSPTPNGTSSSSFAEITGRSSGNSPSGSCHPGSAALVPSLLNRRRGHVDESAHAGHRRRGRVPPTVRSAKLPTTSSLGSSLTGVRRLRLGPDDDAVETPIAGSQNRLQWSHRSTRLAT